MVFGLNNHGQCVLPLNCSKKAVVQVSCGGLHTGVLFEDGSVELFGSNKDGQCNCPNLSGTKVVQISCGGRHTGIVTEDYKISLFGSNHENQCNDKY